MFEFIYNIYKYITFKCVQVSNDIIYTHYLITLLTFMQNLHICFNIFILIYSLIKLKLIRS